MRWIWIATGLIMVVLTAAALLRPTQPPVPLPTVEPAGDEAIAMPQPLDAADIAQLVALRDEIGVGPLPGADSRASSAAFEQELRELAGLAESAPAAKSESEPSSDAPAVLRDAAVALEALAAQDESAADYASADERRLLADQLRRIARLLPHEEPRTAENSPQSADPKTRLD